MWFEKSCLALGPLKPQKSKCLLKQDTLLCTLELFHLAVVATHNAIHESILSAIRATALYKQ